MCEWAAAMSEYHKQSKIVKPKLRLLEIKQTELKEAETDLAAAESELQQVRALQEALNKKFNAQQAELDGLQARAAKTKKKADQAKKLINSLEDNKVRWIQNRDEFKSLKLRLTGDVAKACAFVSYCGPFNSEFRSKLLDEYFHTDIITKAIPVSENLELTQFLVDPATVGTWNLQGLPSDDLSIQNGIMVTRSSRYPLMIDPQGQAINWIKSKEPELETQNCIYTLSHPSLRDALKFPLQEGFPVLIESIEHEVDPMMDPILEKQITIKGRSKLIKLGDTEMDFDDKFRLYMTSRLANPHFSPELAAKATIIDFTVTQGGLEQQLLGRLISMEKKSLEDQLTQLQEEVTANTQTLQNYEVQLLDRLANAQGSLLDDVELIDVLATIKLKSKEVNEKLVEAAEKKIEINQKREEFRPVASQGSVLYFCIVEMTLVNWMYNTSLTQFLSLFDYSILRSPKAQLTKERVDNIKDCLTNRVYRYINRGLFERDKVTFKLMMATKVLIKEGKLTVGDVNLLLKAGSGIDDRNKAPFGWLTDQKAWLNLRALSKHKFGNDHTYFFKELPDRMNRNDSDWQAWYEEAEPEKAPIPDYEEKIAADQNIGHFIRLCLVRSMREDRALLASNQFIKGVLGDEFVAPVTDQISEIFEESRPSIPVLYLLSAGADPTGNIDEFAKKKKQFPTGKVSMGEEQEKPAKQMIEQGFAAGKWVVLNNCHLSLEFMAEMEELLNPKDKVLHEDFRLWITCQSHPEFPLGLLQMAIKVTTEPPKGLQAGLSRTFNTMINQDFLEKVEPYEKWRSLVFSVCFLHSIVQERRKFGPLGFCIPYEFNNADLEASLLYIDKHLTQSAAMNIQYSWKAMRYMVTEVQYGGRITDDLDREMFITYGDLWLQEGIFTPSYQFNASVTEFNYQIPDAIEHARYMEYIQKMPGNDTPSIFGLHPNADRTFRQKESLEMIGTLLDTQPKEASGGGGKSREEEVKEKLEKELLPQLPQSFIWLEVQERLKVLRGPKGLGESGKYDIIPLNIFLSQEIQRFQMILDIVRTTMVNMIDAIDGSIIMTPDIVDSINAIYDFRVPNKWMFDPTGAEISWLTPSLAGWIKGLLDRHFQLNNWVSKERPPSFWLTGFFNPQGFLTAVKQEVTRQKKGWSLDEVEQSNDVTNNVIYGDDGKIEGKTINPPTSEGVFVHGLFLEGAGWDKQDKKLVESKPRELFVQFPIIHVSAISPNSEKDKPNSLNTRQRQDPAALAKTQFSCPVYKYPKRNDKYLVFRCNLKAEAAGAPPNPTKGLTAPMKWRLCNVALLCCRD
mmetsp:Transcript_610/g.1165  ORF Transcript_610/g.1165 Transcript_610/m.1165 type:complete len:1301 (-) Transcript_610:61-3963(-)